MLNKTDNPNIFIYSREIEVAGKLSALVTVPTGFDPAKESLPVILFLHGAGERGTDLELVKIHGTADTAVDHRNSVEMVEAAKARGAQVDFTSYEGVGHGSWAPAYETTDLIEWLVDKTE